MKDRVRNIIDLNKNKVELLKAKPNPKIGWISISTPEELFYAAGLIPFRILGESQKKIADAGGLYSNNICSYVLSCLAEGIEGLYDFTDGIVISDACDARKRLINIWETYIKSEHMYFIALSKDNNKLSRRYLKQQYNNIIERLNTNYNCSIGADELRRAIILTNKTRKLLQELYQFRNNNPDMITSTEVMEIVKASSSGLREELNQELEALLVQLRSGEVLYNGSRKHKVLICGSYFDHANLIETIEQCGASVVCEDISNGYKYFEGMIDETIDPLDAIVDYYFSRSSCARMLDTRERFARVSKLMEEYDIKSVVYFTLKFCDNNLMDYPYFKENLQKLKIPAIFIEGEQGMCNIQNIKTRIQTFYEVII